jgi:hypothetical protein
MIVNGILYQLHATLMQFVTQFFIEFVSTMPVDQLYNDS